MVILIFLIFLFWMLILPLGMGLNIIRFQNQEEEVGISKIYFFGFFFELITFQLLAWVFTYLKGSLTVLTILWLLIQAIAIIIGVKSYLKKKSMILKPKKEKISFDKMSVVIFAVAVAIIVFQVVFVTTHVHDDLDDSWYVGAATTSYFTNTINQISPYTGEIMQYIPIDYILSPWPVFCAMIGKLSLCHPAIIMHTFVPIIFIPMSYVAFALLAKYIFKEDFNKISWFIFFLAVINMFGQYSIRSTSTFLLFRIWQGKAALCNIIIPLVIYFFMLMAEERKSEDTICLFLAVTAGTMLSSMGVFLSPILLGALSFVDLIKQHKMENCIKAFVCIIPCVIQLGIYALMRW